MAMSPKQFGIASTALALTLVGGWALGWVAHAPRKERVVELIHPQSPKFIAARVLAACIGEANCKRCRNCSACEHCKTAIVKCGRYPKPAAPTPGLSERMDQITR